MMSRKVHWVPVSKDAKTGEVPVSYSPKETCPGSCSLKEGGCYAWGLFYLKSLGGKISDGRIELRSLTDALKKIKSTAKIARHRVAGDIVGDVPETIEECKTIKNAGLINIGYTHNWRSNEAQPLKEYFRASCQTVGDVLDARKMGWAATLIVPPGTGKRVTLPNEEVAYKCPARHDVVGEKDITCNTCTLCKVGKSTSNKTVMFEVHGGAATIKYATGKYGKVK